MATVLQTGRKVEDDTGYVNYTWENEEDNIHAEFDLHWKLCDDCTIEFERVQLLRLEYRLPTPYERDRLEREFAAVLDTYGEIYEDITSGIWDEIFRS